MQAEQNRLHEILQDGHLLQRRVEPCRLGDQNAKFVSTVGRRIGGVGQEREASAGLVEVDFSAGDRSTDHGVGQQVVPVGLLRRGIGAGDDTVVDPDVKRVVERLVARNGRHYEFVGRVGGRRIVGGHRDG